MKHILESTLVGLVFVISMRITLRIVLDFKMIENELQYKNLEKTFYKNTLVFDISIFLTGFLIHLLLTFLNTNRLVCKDGVVCCKK